MIEFILARYNYWIVIVLMMTGLYIVFSRGNLVKTIIGLNLFQTSVFVFYITVGKVAGGTAPILVGGHGEDDDHGGDHGAGHGEAGYPQDSHGADAAHHAEPLSAEDAAAYVSGERANALGEADPTHVSPPRESLHTAPEAAAGNALVAPDAPGNMAEAVREGSAEAAAHAADHGADMAHGAADAAGSMAEAVYSNPLPHVLILTAIVVGVATTAVGLAIAIRIREAYGTIEEDALEQMDNAAEFGGEAQR